MASNFDEWLYSHYGTTPPPSMHLSPQGAPSMYQFEGLGPESIPTPQQYAQAQAAGQALRNPPVGPDGMFPMSPGSEEMKRLEHMQNYPWHYGMGERPQAPAQQVPQMPQGQEDALRQQLGAMQFNQYPEMQARGPDESFPSDIAPQDYAQIRDMTAQAYMEGGTAMPATYRMWYGPDAPAPQPPANLDQEASQGAARHQAEMAAMQPAIPGGAQLGGQQGAPEEIWWQNYNALPDPAQGYLPNVNWEHPLSKHNMVDLPRQKQQEEFIAAFGQPPSPGNQNLAQIRNEMTGRDYGLYGDYDQATQDMLTALSGPGAEAYKAALPGAEDQFLYGTIDSPDAPAGALPPPADPGIPPAPTPAPPPLTPPGVAAAPPSTTPPEWAYLDTAVPGQQAKFTPDMAEAIERMQIQARMAGVPIEITGPLSGARTPEEIAELQRRHALPPTDPEYSKFAADPTGRHTESGGYTGVDFIVRDSPDSPQSQFLEEHGGQFGLFPAYKKGGEHPHYHHYGWDSAKWTDNPYADSMGEPAGSASAPMDGGSSTMAPEMPPEVAATPLSAQSGGASEDMGLDLVPIPGRMSETSGKDRLYAQLMGDPNVPMDQVQQLISASEAPLPSRLGVVESGMAQERALGLDTGDIISSPEEAPGGTWESGVMGDVGRTLAHQRFLDEQMQPYEFAGIQPPAELSRQVEQADRRAERVRKGAQEWDSDIRERVRRLRVIANQLSTDRGIARRSEFTDRRTQDAESLFGSLPSVESVRPAQQEPLSKKGGLAPRQFREAVAAMDKEITELTRNLPLESALRGQLETLNRRVQRTPSPDERAPREVPGITEADAYSGQARSARSKLSRFTEVYELNQVLDRYEAWMDRVQAVSRKVKPRRSRSKRIGRQTRINISKRK